MDEGDERRTDDLEKTTVSDQVTTLATGLGFTEGPVWTRDGRLFIVAVNRGKIYEVSIDGSGEVSESVEVGGGPNGLAESPDGALWITQNAGQLLRASSSIEVEASIQKWSRPGGPVETVTTDVLCPSDCTFGPDGRLWFTDSNGPTRDGSLGRIQALNITTGELEVMITEFPLVASPTPPATSTSPRLAVTPSTC